MERRAYAAAGVDVTAGEIAVDLLRSRLRASEHDLLGGIGAFGAVLALPAGYRQPVLVSATDGVGTKTEIARALERHDTIGQDLVAMCADDVVCHGAQPTFFLDYVALGRLEPERVAAIVGGIAAACERVGCALVGGETAEHPGVMEPDSFDLAGFCIGLVERELLLDGSACRAGDVVLGLASSGLHANGFSLVRALIARHGLELRRPYSEVLAEHGLEPDEWWSEARLGDALLEPTRLYAPAVLAVRGDLLDRSLRLGAIQHVTGGGLAANLPRGVPAGLGVRLHAGSWPQPVIFALLARLGGLEQAELRATFNCGVGMSLVLEPAAVGRATQLLAARDIEAWPVGEIVALEEPGGPRYVEVT
ncbi:MAG TPA: phosphoribosylformylglycinamidine cyclo-ligase [Candidatus Limnocylindria bacterium]|nr:phosphoribosylformylglycinamidine cyclo-ligase [Candidatus Limnocylindria bacterium]